MQRNTHTPTHARTKNGEERKPYTHTSARAARTRRPTPHANEGGAKEVRREDTGTPARKRAPTGCRLGSSMGARLPPHERAREHNAAATQQPATKRATSDENTNKNTHPTQSTPFRSPPFQKKSTATQKRNEAHRLRRRHSPPASRSIRRSSSITRCCTTLTPKGPVEKRWSVPRPCRISTNDGSSTTPSSAHSPACAVQSTSNQSTPVPAGGSSTPARRPTLGPSVRHDRQWGANARRTTSRPAAPAAATAASTSAADASGGNTPDSGGGGGGGGAPRAPRVAPLLSCAVAAQPLKGWPQRWAGDRGGRGRRRAPLTGGRRCQPPLQRRVADPAGRSRYGPRRRPATPTTREGPRQTPTAAVAVWRRGRWR
ncbi:hypothetical protein I4F81_006827 [Pyropia yezoensis]|uniref:Uncharacterized protein n=1 Tax=Pyropia yezoensis TaxID=2788 RepID=A0ACC3C2E8_PYRYE|nr:hypothetical protein I4F81_006827 [Neopyropia yezoensis]